MIGKLGEKIDQYSDELFADLGLATLSEEEKADIFARLEEHLHKVILEMIASVATAHELAKIEQALDGENYREVGRLLEQFKELKNKLEQKIEQEFQILKLTIAEEQKHAKSGQPGTEKTVQDSR